MSDPVFRIKNEPLGANIPSFRIRSSTEQKIREISRATNTPLQEVVRQMIDFAIEHMPAAEEKKDD